MPKVTVDVTGYFFAVAVEVDKSATVKEVMDAAVAMNRQAGPGQARILYFKDLQNEFLREIVILHRGGSAKSRQTTVNNASRQYADGLYSYSDDDIVLMPGPNGTTRFEPANPNSSLALAWQYYVYRKTPDGLVDMSRSELGGLTRKVEAFTAAQPFAGFTDDDEFEVVWRLVGLALRPDQPDAGRATMLSSMFEPPASV